MADNVTADPGSGGADFATDDIGGVHYQRVKPTHGADGSATDTSHTNPLPVEGGDAENAAITANPVPVGGRYDASDRTLGDGDAGAIAVDAAGRVKVKIDDGGVLGLADDAVFTVGTTEGVPLIFLADETASDSVDEGDGGVPRMTLERQQLVVDQPHTQGGLSIFRSIDIDETEEDVKTSAGQVYSIIAFNTTAAPLYLKFYNDTAANVVVGTDTPVLTLLVPGNADSDGAGLVWNVDKGLAFGTAICVACTTGVADSDTGAPGANACIVNVGYK